MAEAKVALTIIKVDGKVIQPGEKVTKKEIGEHWDALVEAGAIGYAPRPPISEEESEAPSEEPEE